MLAGAPIPPDLVAGVRGVTGGDVRTPWGMTECLPVTDGTVPEAIGPLGGNSTGRPVPGCSVLVTPLDRLSEPAPDGSWGELLIHAPWMFDGYDAAWSADADTWVVRDGRRYHRTGDVGYVHDGLVFHLGRRRHVLDTPSGPLASVAVEEPVRAAVGRPVAAVGVGPTGTQVVCLVVDGPGHLAVADGGLRSEVRAAAEVPVAAVQLESGSDVTTEDLERLVADALATYKRLRCVVLVDAVPRTPSGKVLRRTLRDEWAPALATAPPN